MVEAPTNRTALITGIGGFAGPHLARLLVDQGVAVVGFTIETGSERSLPRIPDAASLSFGDVRDSDALAACLSEAQPAIVYHLAALSHVGESWSRRRMTFDVNILGTEALLDAMARETPAAKLVLVSTGFVYGKSLDDEGPLGEDHPTRPVSPYAASKLCSEILTQQAGRTRGLRVVVVRPFNFAGPGQEPTFVCSDFARQIAMAEAGLQPPRIVVGNLDVRRDFTDVRDIVRGFERAGHAGSTGATYNLCSGRGTPIRVILDTLLEMTDCPIEVHEDPQRIRPIDLPLFVGDARRAHDELDWRAEVPLAQTLADTLGYWRKQVTAREAEPGAADA